MRPLTILHTEWSQGWGGQEIRILDEATALAAQGHRLLIATKPDCKIFAKARAAGLATREISMRRAFDLRGIRQLRALIRSEHVHIVNTHSSVDSWLATLAVQGTPAKLVRTRHLSAPVPRHPFNIVYRLADGVVTTGEFVRQQLITRNGLDPGKIVSIPTGVDVQHFTPRPADLAAKAALGLPAASPVISIVGILRHLKRHDLFLDAAQRLQQRQPPVRFLIVGDGPQRSRIEEQIRQRNLTGCVTMAGYCADVRSIYSFSDVVVLCSDAEGVPQTIAQALAMARPVVATNVGGVSELVENERTGLLIAAGKAGVLAESIARFLDEPAFGRECGTRGRDHICRSLSRERMIERTLELYEKLLA
jgi:glycosyltransferase involved in cell wall biosynthesis